MYRPADEGPMRHPTADLPATLTTHGQTLAIGPDVAAFVSNLAYPCQVPYSCLVHASWTPEAGPDEPAIVLIVGPEGQTDYQIYFFFNANSRWLGSRFEGYSSNRVAAQCADLTPQNGFLAEEAALILATNVLKDDSSFSWGSGNAIGRNSGDIKTAREAKLAHVARLRIRRQVRFNALETLAGEHYEEFAEHYEAQQVLRALSSDWYPDPYLK